MRFAKRVRALREGWRRTHAVLARDMEVTTTDVSMLESGTRRAPSLPTLRKLAETRGVSVATLPE